MEDPQITRDTYAEAERRMTGGPDAVAALELMPAEAREKLEDSPAGAIEALWSSWLDLTVKLQGFGFPARTLCDASNTVAEAWEKTRTAAGQHTHSA